MGIASVSVDLDSLVHYCRIHGLDEAGLPPASRGLVYQQSVLCFLDLFDELQIKATFFVVGSELDNPEAVANLARAVAAGHEIASHSYSHDYALTRRPAAEIESDLSRADRAIREALHVEPRGFRAPGYTLTGPLLAAVAARGYAYDSSVFPAAPYWAAKALIMGALSLAGRPSRAILDRPSVVLAPRLPYRPDEAEPYRRGASRVIELPIAVEPLTRIPLLGTALVAAPSWATRPLVSRFKGQPFLNLELHGIDLLDARDVAYPALSKAQPDLAPPRPEKRRRLRDAIARIRDDFEVMTLARAADRFAAHSLPDGGHEGERP